VLKSLLAPGGRLLNHAISQPLGRGGFDRNSFVARYVFLGVLATEEGNSGMPPTRAGSGSVS
jgi:cyclopropane fatty-acyl-phospholipid synthase-like methyltransferase